MARLIARLLPAGIQARLFLLIAIVLLPITLVLGWTNFQRYLSLREIRLQSEAEVAQGIGTAFAAHVSGHREVLHITGQAILAFSPYTDAKVTGLLTEGAAHSPAIRNLSWVGPDGTILASTIPALVGRSLAHRPYFQDIVAGRPWTISDLFPRGSVTASPIFFIAVEARDDAGTLQGVVVAGIGPEEVGKLTLRQDRPAGGRIAIFDRQGTVVYLSHPVPLAWESRQWKESDHLLRQALATGEAQAGMTSPAPLDGKWVAARVPIVGIDWVAGAARPAAVAFAPFRQTILRDSALAALIAGAAFLLAYLIARSIARPLQLLEHGTSALRAGRDLELRDDYAPIEVESLSRTISAMASGVLAAKEAAEQATRAKSEFVANVSHELRTPMTVIMGSLEFLRESISDPDQHQLLDLSATAAQRLLGIIDDLLDISRIEAGRIKIEDRPFDLRECVRQAAEFFIIPAQEKGVDLHWQVAPQLPARVSGDPDRLTQVLVNLVGNAVKFTERGEIALTVTAAGEDVLFSVRDTGIGIPPEKIEDLFEPFVQVDSSLTRRHRGTGLGLAICKELVALMQGTIRVESQVGRGSTFAFTLPLQRLDAKGVMSNE